MKKINFLQKKYIIPLFALPFVIFIAYMISTFEGPKEETNLVEVDGFNNNLQDPTFNNKSMDNKLDALKQRLKKEGDFTSVQNVDKEEVEDEMITNSASLYTTDEMRTIDSLNQINQIRNKELQEKVNSYRSKDYTKNSNDKVAPQTFETGAGDEVQLSEEEIQQKKIEAQMHYLDSISKRNVENATYKVKKETIEQVTGENTQSSSFFNTDESAIEVKKSERQNTQYFNTLGNNNDNNCIMAILDESIKVVAGSRVKIRLMEDICVGDYELKQGQYLYGTVDGFTAQRVKIKVNSILIKGKPTKVKLSVYDLDGIEGFYIPESAFRDFTKEAGSKATNQNINIESGQGGIEQFTYKVIQDIYRSGTQAVSKTIRQNKANLKYATQIYLVNDDDNN